MRNLVQQQTKFFSIPNSLSYWLLLQIQLFFVFIKEFSRIINWPFWWCSGRLQGLTKHFFFQQVHLDTPISFLSRLWQKEFSYKKKKMSCLHFFLVGGVLPEQHIWRVTLESMILNSLKLIIHTQIPTNYHPIYAWTNIYNTWTLVSRKKKLQSRKHQIFAWSDRAIINVFYLLILWKNFPRIFRENLLS